MNVRDVYKIAVDAKRKIRAVRSAAIDAELNKIFERIKKEAEFGKFKTDVVLKNDCDYLEEVLNELSNRGFKVETIDNGSICLEISWYFNEEGAVC